ncbi:hypothetical protein SUGI_0245270 [Cryptomeria japonica]|nr:hypothetical protein SUGI_0245270 [Cryptomeria japonica]
MKINDISTFTIDVNLWGILSEELGEDLKNMHSAAIFFILAVQNAQVGYFNEKVISTIVVATLDIKPFIPEAETLRMRGEIPAYLHPDSASSNLISSRYNRMTIASILECMSVAPETIETSVIVVLRFIKDDPFYYTSCPLEINGKERKMKCNKLNDNLRLCPRCQTTMPECNYKYLLQMKLQDATGNLWANGFEEVGIQLLDTSAK